LLRVEILNHGCEILVHNAERPEGGVEPLLCPHDIQAFLEELGIFAEPVDILQVEVSVKDVFRAHEFQNIRDGTCGKHVFNIFLVDSCLETLDCQGVGRGLGHDKGVN